MNRKIIIVLLLSVTALMAVENNEGKTNLTAINMEHVDLNTKLEANDWLDWLSKLGRNKKIDPISKKKITKGAELIAENISKKRSFIISEKIEDIDDDGKTSSDEWKLAEQKVTLEQIAQKLSSMTLNEIIQIYEKYGKKEIKEVNKNGKGK